MGLGDREPSYFREVGIYYVIGWAGLVLALVAALLEYLGIIHDVGMVVSVAGTAITTLGFVTAASRKSARELRYWTALLRGDLQELRTEVRGIRDGLTRIATLLDERLPRA